MRTRKDHLLIVVFSVAKETSCTANANPGNKCIKYAANKAFLKGFWMSQMAGMECNGLTASSASEGTSHNSLLETKIRLGDKAPALVPYMDEPYTATARR